MTNNRKMTLARAATGGAETVLTALNDGNHVDAKRVDGNIRMIATTGKGLDALIHGTAVACIHLSMPHKDGGHNCAARAAKLVNSMPKGSRVKALIAWFAAYSNIRLHWDKDAKAYKGGVLKPTAKGYADARPNDGMAKPFWTVEEQAVDPAAFTTDMFRTRLAKLLKIAEASADLDTRGKAALAALKGVAAKLERVK